MYTTITQSDKKTAKFNLNLVDKINHWIVKEQKNYFGICGMLLIVGTGIASIPVALATGIQFFIVAGLSVILTMMGNVTVISQQPLKTVVWTFIVGISINIILMIYLLWYTFV